MTREEKKRYLNAYSELKHRIDSLTEEYHFWEEEAKSVPIANLNNMGIHTSKKREPLTKHIDICIEIAELIDQAKIALKKIISAIDSVDNPDYRKVLMLRHVDCLFFHEIAKRLNYSLPGVYKIYRQALDQLSV